MSAIQQVLSAVSSSSGITFLSKGTVGQGNSATVPLPPIHNGGDLLVMCATGNNNFTSPAGWSVGVNNTSTSRTCVWYKIDSGIETDVVLSGGGNSAQIVMLAYTGVNATPLDTNGVVATANSATATTTSLTTTTANALVLSVFDINATAVAFSSYPSGTTVRHDGSSLASRNPILVADEIQAVAGATSARSTTLVSDRWQAYAISFKA